MCGYFDGAATSMLLRSTTGLRLVMLSTLVACNCDGLTHSDATSSVNASNVTDLRTDSTLGGISSELERRKTNYDGWHKLAYNFGIGTRTDRSFDRRTDRETTKNRYRASYVRGIRPVDNSSEHWIGSDAISRGIRRGMTFRQLHGNNATGRRSWLGVDDIRRPKRFSDEKESEEQAGKDGINFTALGYAKRTGHEFHYNSTLPDGFSHYYRPTSNIANFFLLNIIQPRHMLFLRQSKEVAQCLVNRTQVFDLPDMGVCFASLTGDVLVPRWLMHCIGFIIVCFIIIIIAIFLLVTCPCLMCWRTKCREVVQAGKLDTWSNTEWALITVFSCLSMLFAFFGLLAFACAGFGLGYCLHDELVAQIYTAYKDVRAIHAEVDRTVKVAFRRSANVENVRRASLLHFSCVLVSTPTTEIISR